MYDDYDDGEDGGASLGRKLALGIGVVAIAAAGFFAFKAVTKEDGGGAAVSPADGSAQTAETNAAPDGSAAGDELSAGATTEPVKKPVASDAPTTTAAVVATTTTSAAAATTTVPVTAAPTPAPPPAPPAAAPYDTLPDGSPAWVIALFGVDRITLQGVVPDEAAKQRLEELAVINAKPGQAATVDNQLTLNPAVPRSVGVRVVELTSARFPEGSADILPEHAAELDRAANVMNALPNITALVIGHADQRGNETSNYAISKARADAVMVYLASRGIAPDRLSSRAVGEADLLTLNNDDAAFALNRRTEFVFIGLLQV